VQIGVHGRRPGRGRGEGGMGDAPAPPLKASDPRSGTHAPGTRAGTLPRTATELRPVLQGHGRGAWDQFSAARRSGGRGGLIPAQRGVTAGQLGLAGSGAGAGPRARRCRAPGVLASSMDAGTRAIGRGPGHVDLCRGTGRRLCGGKSSMQRWPTRLKQRLGGGVECGALRRNAPAPDATRQVYDR